MINFSFNTFLNFSYNIFQKIKKMKWFLGLFFIVKNSATVSLQLEQIKCMEMYAYERSWNDLRSQLFVAIPLHTVAS